MSSSQDFIATAADLDLDPVTFSMSSVTREPGNE